MKAVFLCRDVYYFAYPLIAKALSDEFGVETFAITYSSKTCNIIQKRHPDFFKKILNLDEYFFRNDNFIDVSLEEKLTYLADVEKKLDIPSIYTLIYVDRTLVKHEYADMVTIAYGNCKFVLEEFANEGFDLVVGEVGTFLESIMWKLSLKTGIRHLHLTSARTGGKLVAMYGDAYDIVGFKNTYDSLKNAELTDEDKRQFEKFYAEYIRGEKKPDYIKKVNLPAKVLNIILAYLERKRYSNRSRYFFESIDTSSIRQLIWLRLKKHVNRHLLYKLWRVFSPLPSSRYIFFPLHLEPELATLLLAPYYVNQLSVIENIAKSIPAGYRLVVKEHPNMFGLRSASFYKTLNSFPNVSLVHPLEDSYKIVKNADAVIVITSSVGLEGILFEKPVYVLGNAFFREYEKAYAVENIQLLPVLMRDGLREFRSDRDALMKFVLSYIKCTYDGIMGNSLEDRKYLSDENIKNFAKVLISAYSTEKWQ